MPIYQFLKAYVRAPIKAPIIPQTLPKVNSPKQVSVMIFNFMLFERDRNVPPIVVVKQH